MDFANIIKDTLIAGQNEIHMNPKILTILFLMNQKTKNVADCIAHAILKLNDAELQELKFQIGGR